MGLGAVEKHAEHLFLGAHNSEAGNRASARKKSENQKCQSRELLNDFELELMFFGLVFGVNKLACRAKDESVAIKAMESPHWSDAKPGPTHISLLTHTRTSHTSSGQNTNYIARHELECGGRASAHAVTCSVCAMRLLVCAVATKQTFHVVSGPVQVIHMIILCHFEMFLFHLLLQPAETQMIQLILW